MKILDLTGKTSLTPALSKEIEKIAKEIRSQYVGVIDEISLLNMKNIDWWVLPIATRNTFTSPLLIDTCRILMLKHLISLGLNPEEIIVQSPGMLEIVNTILTQNGLKCKVKYNAVIFNKNRFIGLAINIFKGILNSSIQKIIALIAMPSVEKIKERIILIDTYVYSSSFKDNEFNDRHYPDIEAPLNTDEKQKIRYFPTFYGKSRYNVKVIRGLSDKNNRFLMKESFLSLVDYTWTLLIFFRLKRIRIPKVNYISNVDISPLILEGIKAHCILPSTIDALLKYRAIKNMKISGIRIDKAINWFENQDIDRAMNSALRINYPDCKIVGYVGYVPANHYLCAYPSNVEQIANIIPNLFAVMGPAFFESIREFAPNLSVTLAPAFRYKHIFKSHFKKKSSNILTILIALPVVKDEAIELLVQISHSLAELREKNNEKIKLIIKPHPAMKNFTFNRNLFKNISDLEEDWATGPIHTLLMESDVLVTRASTAAFESLLLGLPVVIIANSTDLTHVSIPSSINSRFWTLFYPGDSFYEAIMSIKNEWKIAMKSDVDPAAEIINAHLALFSNQDIKNFLFH